MLLLVVFLLSFSAFASTLDVPLNDPNLYLSQLNWFVDPEGAYAQTNNPGAYIKVGFTGTSLDLVLNQTNTPNITYATLAWSVDDDPFVYTTLPTAQDVVSVASGLASGNHSLVVYLFNSLQSVDRWVIPLNVFRICGLQIDDGAQTLPPVLRPKRLAVYWDSIGEGVNTLGNNGGDLENNASPFDSQNAVAVALNAELSLIAFGGQGYSVAGGGNVPGIFDPVPDRPQAWNMQDSVHPRDWAESDVDYIFCGHGTNDYFHKLPGHITFLAVLGWLTVQRAATPNAVIFVTIPYGGFLRESITAGYGTYQERTPDKLTYLIDLGAEAEIGLNACGQATKEAIDCVHPLVWRNGQLGALLATAAASSGLL